jgi:1,4-alpha-glucan branching enzyme
MDDNSLVEVKPVPVENAGAAANGGSTFLYTDTKANTVHVAGDFNAWLDNVDGKVTGHGEWLLQNDGAGNWRLTAPLPPGRHKYKFVIDGGARWETDPTMPVATDGNSVIEVPGTALAPPAAPAPKAGSGVSFTYADPAAKTVFVAGEFNEWNMTANPMQKNASGTWTATIPLKPGKYQYKFVVDGNWKPDPANPDAVDDTYGGKNSVKAVGP